MKWKQKLCISTLAWNESGVEVVMFFHEISRVFISENFQRLKIHNEKEQRDEKRHIQDDLKCNYIIFYY